ncbi:hypothetical protein [Pseudonocardia sp. HH130630-07]|uniref:hypothetical protein n=1 Tax=Pseudonocardia sp. HH130630-07 TaxID=1690815 RepID=UPI00081511E0|nr:hypothetical protein [Pseudonocardia sp. HH130630-07]ANY09290.1 hypothetical protein AFB00_27015 [Pseudonocardia sp. HH130630-07]
MARTVRAPRVPQRPAADAAPPAADSEDRPSPVPRSQAAPEPSPAAGDARKAGRRRRASLKVPARSAEDRTPTGSGARPPGTGSAGPAADRGVAGVPPTDPDRPGTDRPDTGSSGSTPSGSAPSPAAASPGTASSDTASAGAGPTGASGPARPAAGPDAAPRNGAPGRPGRSVPRNGTTVRRNGAARPARTGRDPGTPEAGPPRTAAGTAAHRRPPELPASLRIGPVTPGPGGRPPAHARVALTVDRPGGASTGAPGRLPVPAAPPLPPRAGTPVPDELPGTRARGAGRGRNGPLREAGAVLARRRRPLLVLALLAAVAGAATAWAVPPPVVATASVQVATVGTADPAGATARALGAATNAAFTARVAELSGAAGAEAAEDLSVTTPAPGVVRFRVSGSDPAVATAVADDAVTALRERVATLDRAVTAAGTDPVRAELDRLTAPPPDELGTQTRTNGTTEPDPLVDQFGRVLADRTAQTTVIVPGPAAVATPWIASGWWIGAAGVLAGVLAGLLGLLGVLAARRGRRLLPEADPAGALRAEIDVPVLAPGTAPAAVPLLADAYRTRLRTFPTVTVVQLTAEPACDVAAELVKAAELVGDRRVWVDLTPGAAPPGPVSGPRIRSMRVRRATHEDLRTLRGCGPTVLAVQTAGTRSAEVATTVAALRAVGAPPVLCLVWTGRLPRDPARVPLPADARTRSTLP